MRRILGLDYGTKTVGVALSDELRITAQPLETITRKDANKLRKTYARIEELVLWDERLTTVASEKVLMESGVRRENRKKVIDQIAASMILQGYLDSL